MYERAVSRAQPRLQLRQVYFLRYLTDNVICLRAPPASGNEQSEKSQGFDITKDWIYTPLRRGDLFFVENKTCKCGILMNDGFSSFRQVEVEEMWVLRHFPAICSYLDRFLYVSGGINEASVERFDVERGIW